MLASTLAPAAMAGEPKPQGAVGGATPVVVSLGTLPAPPASPFASPEPVSVSLQAVEGGAHADDDDTAPAQQRPPSSASAASVPRSVSSLDPRVSAQLELALSSMRRCDGAREARTLLPGVDLLQHFGMAGDEDNSENGAENEGEAHLNAI